MGQGPEGWTEGNTFQLWFKKSWNPSWPAGSEFLTWHPALTQNRKLYPICRFLFIEGTSLPTSFRAQVHSSFSLRNTPTTGLSTRKRDLCSAKYSTMSLSKKQTRGPRLVFRTHFSKYRVHWGFLKAAADLAPPPSAPLNLAKMKGQRYGPRNACQD